MVALKVEDVRSFTSKLFVKEDFDRFLVKEINIITYNSFTIDGHVRQGYYTQEELEENRIEDFSSWKMLRPLCFSLIKGKKTSRKLPYCAVPCPRGCGKVCSFPGHGNRWQPDSGIVSEYPLRRRSIILYNGNFAELFYPGQDTGKRVG